MRFKRGQTVEVVKDWSEQMAKTPRKGTRGIVADVIEIFDSNIDVIAYRVTFPGHGSVYCNDDDLALVESAASDEATDAQMQADAKAVREFVEQQHQQRETIRQQAAEIERLKASNAELRASADEAQTARLAAVAEAAAMRERLQQAESRVKVLEAALYRKLDVAREALAWYAATECRLADGDMQQPICTYDDGERARRALATIGEEHL